MSNNDSKANDSSNPFASPPNVSDAEELRTDDKYVCDATGYNALEKGWRLAIDNFLPFLGLVVLHEILRIPCDYLDDFAYLAETRLPPIGWAFQILYQTFIGHVISVGAFWIFLKAARRETFAVEDMFAGFHQCYWQIVGGGFLKGLAVVLGLICLIIPGIYLSIRLSFVEVLIIDRHMNIRDAFNESWRMTEHYQPPLLFLLFMGILIEIAGLLLCCVGSLFSAMWLASAYAIFYYSICLRDPDGSSATNTQ